MTQQERSIYLRRCAVISLKKRWPYSALAAALVAVVLLLLSIDPLVTALCAILTMLLVLGGIALNSVRRHAADL